MLSPSRIRPDEGAACGSVRATERVCACPEPTTGLLMVTTAEGWMNALTDPENHRGHSPCMGHSHGAWVPGPCADCAAHLHLEQELDPVQGGSSGPGHGACRAPGYEHPAGGSGRAEGKRVLLTEGNSWCIINNHGPTSSDLELSQIDDAERCFSTGAIGLCDPGTRGNGRST